MNIDFREICYNTEIIFFSDELLTFWGNDISMKLHYALSNFQIR